MIIFHVYKPWWGVCLHAVHTCVGALCHLFLHCLIGCECGCIRETFFLELVQGGNTLDWVPCKPFKYSIAQTKASCPLRSKVGVVLGKSVRKLQTEGFSFFFCCCCLFVCFINEGPKISGFLYSILNVITSHDGKSMIVIYILHILTYRQRSLAVRGINNLWTSDSFKGQNTGFSRLLKNWS